MTCLPKSGTISQVMGVIDFTVTHRKTEVKDKVTSHNSTLEGNLMAWGAEKSHGRF